MCNNCIKLDVCKYAGDSVSTCKQYVDKNKQVKQGHWIICADGYYPYCSVCKSEPKSRIMTHYCAECGAEMSESET